ncbi:MAG: DNA-processing protein DprA [Ruminococcus sp.]|nr:DNA-processing protein DprA [Ruminococcus sp.]
MNDTKYWVWLSIVFGNTVKRLWNLMSYYENAEEAYHEFISSGANNRLSQKEKEKVRSYSLESAEEIVNVCRKKSIEIVRYDSDDYPVQLEYIADPPLILYYKGNIRCLSGAKTITSVGTRHAGRYSTSAARRICSELAMEDVVIISGFATGIDIASQLAAAEMGKPTACVLGCGIDVDYPRENIVFRDKILASGGVFVSEYPPGTSPAPGNFPRRNRILSALGRATMVFEASIRSGSLITARLALDQGKELFVLPPADIFSNSYSGNSDLLRDGAIPLLSTEDVLEFFTMEASAAELRLDAFDFLNGGSISRGASGASDELYDEDDEAEDEVDGDADDEDGAEIDLDDIPEGVQRDIMKLLSEESPLHADVIAVKLGVDASELMPELTELEIIGAVEALPGRSYSAKI